MKQSKLRRRRSAGNIAPPSAGSEDTGRRVNPRWSPLDAYATCCWELENEWIPRDGN
jgi:hypothetical protein